MYVLFTKHPGKQYRPIHAHTAAPFGHVSSTVLPGCLVNDTFVTCTARLPTLFSLFFVVVLGVKTQSISSNNGPAERSILRNMDRSRMPGLKNCLTKVTCRVIIHDMDRI